MHIIYLFAMEEKFTEAFNVYCKQHKLPLDKALLLEYSEHNKHIYLITTSSSPSSTNLHLLVINFQQATNLFNAQSFSVSQNKIASIKALNNAPPQQIQLHPFNKNQLALVYSNEVQFITNVSDAIAKCANNAELKPTHSYKGVHDKSKIKQFKWSYFDNCYGVLYDNGAFCYCDVNSSESMFEVDRNNNNSRYSDDTELVDFAFCPKCDKGFEMFFVYLLYANGLIEVCGPFLPRQFTLSSAFVDNTRTELESKAMMPSQGVYTNYSYCTELLSEIDRCSAPKDGVSGVVTVTTNANLQALNNTFIVKRHLYVEQLAEPTSKSVFDACVYVKLVVVHCVPFTCVKISKGGEIEVVVLCEEVFPLFRRGIRFKEEEAESVVLIEGRVVEKIVIGDDVKEVVRTNKEGNELYVKAGDAVFKVEMRYLEKMREVLERKWGDDGKRACECFSIVKKVVDMKKREIKRTEEVKQEKETKEVKKEENLCSQGNSFINIKQEDTSNKNTSSLFQAGNNNNNFTFSNSSNQNNNKSSGSIFGNNAKETNTAGQQTAGTSGGSLFGNFAKINTGSLFSSAQTTNSQGTNNSGLFNKGPTTNLFSGGTNANANTNSNLFAGGTNTNNSGLFSGGAKTSTPNLFGGGTNANTSNIFGGGAKTNTNTTTNNSNLFSGGTSNLFSGGANANTPNLFSGGTKTNTNTNTNNSGLFSGGTTANASNIFSKGPTTNTPNLFGADTKTNTNTNTNNSNLFSGGTKATTTTNANSKGNNLFSTSNPLSNPPSTSTSEPKDTSKQHQPQQPQSLPQSTSSTTSKPKEHLSYCYNFASLFLNANQLLILCQNATTFQTQVKLLSPSQQSSIAASTMLFNKSIPLHPFLSTNHSLPSYTTTSDAIKALSSSLATQSFQTANPFKHTSLSLNLSSISPDTNIEQFLLAQVNSLISFYENSIYFNYNTFISKCNLMMSVLNEIDMSQCEQRCERITKRIRDVNEKMKAIQTNSNAISAMITQVNGKIMKMCAFNNKKNKGLKMVEEFQKESIEKMKDMKKAFELIDMKYKEVITKFSIDGIYYERLAIGNEFVNSSENIQESLGLYIDKEIKKLQSK